VGCGGIDPTLMFAGTAGDSRLGEGLRRLSERLGGLAGIPFDERAFWRSGDVALLQQRQWSTPELRLERGVLHHPPTGVRLVGWLRIDNRDDLRRRLGAEARGLGATDGGLVLLSWLRWGDGLCERLLGDFAIAIHDPRDRSLLLVRDPMGVKPLYYMETGGALAFATGIGVLADLAGPDLTLSEEWLARYVADCASDPERTVYRQVRKVPPGHLLRFRNGRSELCRHFAFDPEARDGFRSSAERLEAYRGLLAEATACRVRAEGAVACELSGGLDSATVTAHAALAMQDAGERLHAVGFATEEQEPRAILSVGRTVPLADTQIVTGSRARITDLEATERLVHRRLGAPLEHDNGLSHLPLYLLAHRAGAKVLLSGFGGDEFVTFPGHEVARADLWRSGNLSAWARSFRGNALTRPLRLLKWWYHRLGEKLAAGRRMPRWVEVSLALCVLRDGVFDACDVRGRVLRQAGVRPIGDRTPGEWCLQRWEDRPDLVARLENCTLMAAGHGLDYRWPLLDVRLIAFFLAAPTREKVGACGVNRHLHRRAVADILPDFVVWKDKSMGGRVRIPERWRRRGAAGGPDAPMLRHEDLNPRLGGLVDPERLGRVMAEAAALDVRLRAGSAWRRDEQDWAWLCHGERRRVMQLDRWLSAVDGD